jgi:hypothetical protein
MNDETRGMWQEAIVPYFKIRRYVQKFPDLPPGARTANGTAFCH